MPSDDEVLDRLKTLRVAEPELGLKKVLDRIKRDTGWQLSLDRLKSLANSNNLHTLQPGVLYRIVDITRKGLGATSAVPIEAGTCVISEYAMLIAPRDAADQGYDQLTPSARKIFDSLVGTGPGSSNAERIFQSNAYRWTDEHAALFPTMPRWNHDCTPNCTYQQDMQNQKGSFWAIRPINVGEEMTLSYCERVQPRSVRRRQLKESYGFDCVCSTCALEGAEALASDTRRIACQILDDLIARNEDYDRRLCAVHLRIQWLTDESLDGPDVARSLNDAAQIAVLQGHKEIAASYASLAANKYRLGGNIESAKDLEKKHDFAKARFSLAELGAQVKVDESDKIKLKDSIWAKAKRQAELNR